MLDVRIFEKIRALKEKFSLGDDDVKNQITMWENEVKRLADLSDFVQLPAVVTIQKILKDRLKGIMTERATGRGHTAESLKSLEDRELEIRYCLSLFTPKYEQSLQTLENLIDEELI